MAKSPSASRRAVFALSYKGGVGKTTFVSLLGDRLRRDGVKAAIFDGDGETGSLVKAFGTRREDDHHKYTLAQDPFVGCGFFDARVFKSRATLVNALDLGADVLVYDLPAGVLNEMGMVYQPEVAAEELPKAVKALVDEYAREGYRITIAVVITPDEESIQTINAALRLFGGSVDYVVVRNIAAGPDPDDFRLFDGFNLDDGSAFGGKTKAKLLEAGGTVIDMPVLSRGTKCLLNAARLTPSSAIDDVDTGRKFGLTRIDRSRVFQWREAADKVLDGVKPLLGLK